MSSQRRPWVVGVTGASGTPYSAALIRELLRADRDVDLILSRAAHLTVLDETGIRIRDNHWQEDVRTFCVSSFGLPMTERACAQGREGVNRPVAGKCPSVVLVRSGGSTTLACGPRPCGVVADGVWGNWQPDGFWLR